MVVFLGGKNFVLDDVIELEIIVESEGLDGISNEVMFFIQENFNQFDKSINQNGYVFGQKMLLFCFNGYGLLFMVYIQFQKYSICLLLDRMGMINGIFCIMLFFFLIIFWGFYFNGFNIFFILML